jgi:heme A synthase
MARSAPRGDADELARFRRLTGWTILATFVLILIGGVVRVSDSGLGCGAAGSGTEGWPLCEGRLLPFLESTAIVEFSHRVAATIVAGLIVALAWVAVRRLRHHRLLVRGSVAAGVLVLAQAGLGGLTVEEGLQEGLVAAHLGLAMLLLGLLVFLRRLADPAPADPAAAGGRGLRVLAGLASTLLFATIVAGGLVAGTEGEGTANAPALGAHTACGQEFPTCVGELWPFGTSRLIDIQLTHRLFMYLAALAVLAMVAVALRRRARSRAFPAAALLLVAQISLGAANVWAGEHAGLIVGHLALGTLLWATVMHASASLAAVPAPAPEPLTRRDAAGDPAAA